MIAHAALIDAAAGASSDVHRLIPDVIDDRDVSRRISNVALHVENDVADIQTESCAFGQRDFPRDEDQIVFGQTLDCSAHFRQAFGICPAQGKAGHVFSRSPFHPL